MQRTWLITGVSSGLGRALAQEVIAQGDVVIGTVRSLEDKEKFRLEFGDKGRVESLDVTHFEAIDRLFQQWQSDGVQLDVVVNNAGFGFAGAVEESSLEEIRAVMEANFFGATAITQKAVECMQTYGAGRIIQISSHAGIKSFPGFGVYNAAKYALEGMSEALAAEVAPLGIKVSLIEPGPFRTNFAGGSLRKAARRLPQYDDNAGAFRDKLAAVDGLQEGDPAKAAQAIWDLSLQATPPLRLPLGKTALLTIAAKIKALQHDLDNAKEIAARAVFEA